MKFGRNAKKIIGGKEPRREGTAAGFETSVTPEVYAPDQSYSVLCHGLVQIPVLRMILSCACV